MILEISIISADYKDQRATVMDILSQNSRKEYPKPVAGLLRLEKKYFCKASVT
jgi:hypothetical protein